MATWKRVLTEVDIGTTVNSTIGTDSDLSLGTTEHVSAINVTDGVITSMTKQTLNALELGAWKTTGTVEDDEFPIVDDGNTKEFRTLTAAEMRSALSVTTASVQATALALKATVASQAFTGTPSLPTGTTAITQLGSDSSTKLATTAFVNAATSSGDLTAIVAGAGITGSSLTGPIPTLTLDLTELPSGSALLAADDQIVYLDDGVQKKKTVEDVNLGAFNNDQSWTANAGTTTASNSQTFTGKSGNISQWTNNSSYVTSSGVTSVAASTSATNGLSLSGGTITGTGTIAITGTLALGSLSTTGQSGTVATIAGLAPNTATTQATQGAITSAANLVTVGALGSGSITTGFGAINNGSSNITTTGTVSCGTLQVNAGIVDVESETLSVKDSRIVLNSDYVGSAGTDAGLIVERDTTAAVNSTIGASYDACLMWDETAGRWRMAQQNASTKVLPTTAAATAPGSSATSIGFIVVVIEYSRARHGAIAAPVVLRYRHIGVGTVAARRKAQLRLAATVQWRGAALFLECSIIVIRSKSNGRKWISPPFHLERKLF